MQMPMRESFLKLLNGEKTDEVVWTADLSYWIAGQKQAGTADPAWDTEEGYLKLHAELGVMPYYYYENFWTGGPVYDDTVSTGGQTEGDRSVRLIETPVGTLREESVFLTQSCCQAISQHFVQTPGEMDVLIYVLERRRLEPANLDGFGERVERWLPYDGLPCLGMPRSPLAALCCEWTGVQNLAYLLADCPEKVERASVLLEEQEQPVLEAVCELAPPLVHFPDNLSSENLAGLYDAHMRDRHRHRIEQLHAAGVKCAVHLDGTVRGLLPKLVASGFDAIEALTPTPAGDLSAEEMADLAASDTAILWGGVPGAMFAHPYTWERMAEHIEDVLATWRDRPFVLGVADQVPPGGDIDFCRKISDMAASFRL